MPDDLNINFLKDILGEVSHRITEEEFKSVSSLSSEES